MKTELEILQDISEKLEATGISYMLTGSFAMNYYATPRMTRDVDIVIELKEKDIQTLLNLFGQEYYIDSESIKLAIQSEKLFNIIHLESFIKIDFIVRKQNSFRLQEFERREKISFGTFEIFIVSKEDLILSKLSWSKSSKSEMQTRDILNLLDTGFDKSYLEKNAESLGVDKWLEEICNG